MKRVILSMLALMAIATGAEAYKGWTSKYYQAANGLLFQRKADNTLKLIKPGRYYEYYGELSEDGLTATSTTNKREVLGIYNLSGYEIPAEVYGMPVVEMENSVFSKNDSIKSIKFPDGQLTVISYSAFSGCPALERLDFSGSSIRRIEREAFKNCTALKSIDNWGAVDSLGVYAFTGCTALEELSIAPCITKICPSAFNGCTNLKTVRFENTDVRIHLTHGDGIFSKCPVEKVYLGRKLANNNASTFANGCLFQKHTTITDFELGEKIDTIPNSLFNYMTSTMTVKAPNVVHIADRAFANSKNITLVAPKLRSIGTAAFSQSVLPSFDFSTVEIIGTEAFYKCTLDPIILPKNVKQVFKSAFSSISTKTFRIEDGDEPIELGVNELFGEDEPLKRYCNIGWLSTSLLEELYIGRPIGHDEKLTQQNNALLFGSYGGGSCLLKNVKTVTLTSVKGLFNSSFNGCNKLETVNIPLLQAIPSHCFQNCTALTWEGLNMPDVTSIGDLAFANCTSLEEFTISGKVTAVGSYRGDYTFKGCTALKKLTIEYSPTSLINYGIGGIDHLEKLYIDREIGEGTYWYVTPSTLREVTFGSNVGELFSGRKQDALNGYSIQASNVQTVCCLSATPIVLNPIEGTDGMYGDLFPRQYNIQQNATLIVPYGSVDAYRSALVWKGFFNIVDNASSIKSVSHTVDGEGAFYDLGGRRVSGSPRLGVYVKEGKTGGHKVVLGRK